MLLGGGAFAALALIAAGFFLVTQPRTPTSTGAASCGPLQLVADEGRGHLGPTDPTPVYRSNPPTSGTHNPESYPPGVYLNNVDPTKLVHSLEHGYIVIYHNGLTEEQVSQLANIQRSDPFKVIVTPYPTMPNKIALAAWNRLQACDGVSEQTIRSFISQFRGQGPEPGGA